MKMRASLLQFASALIAVVSVAAVGLAFARHNATTQARLDAQDRSSLALSQIRAKYGQLPLSFEANLGQTAPEVQFLSHGYGYELFLTRQEAVLTFMHPDPVSLSPSHHAGYRRDSIKRTRTSKASVLRLHFADANPDSEVRGINRLPGRTDYFIGNDPTNWRTGVPSYAEVAYHSFYPGIDAVFYGNQRQLEYDFRVSPGASSRQIAFNVEGATSLKSDSAGNLLMTVGGDTITLLKPVAYQDDDGNRREIAANYSVGSGNRVTFLMGGYDTSKPLVIDPVLDYSTYLGGSAGGTGSFTTGFFDTANAIAVDSKGDAYVAGQTFSAKFPTTSNITPPDASVSANGAVFVTELNPGGTAEAYSSYLSGNGGEIAFGIALDSSGKIYVAGETFSSNFPGTGSGTNGFEPNPPTPANLSSFGIGFISKIDPTQSGATALTYSSYLGGSDGDFANSIAADSNGNAYVAGFTISSDFPMTSPTTGYQTAPTGTAGNAFLVKVNTTTQTGAASLIYSTYLGGDGAKANVPNGFTYGDEAFGVAVDSTGTAYLAGETTSSNFPTVNALQSGPNPSEQFGEAFVSRIDTTKSGTNSLIYSTYLGGEVTDIATAVALEPGNATPANAVYVTGQTQSTQFPKTSGAYLSTANVASGLVFATVIDTTQTTTGLPKYSALVGGSGGDEGYGIQVDSSGNAYVVGSTGSVSPSPFPTTAGAFQTGNSNAVGNAFVFELNPGGHGTADLLYSTYFGGSGTNAADAGLAIALDPSNNVYITGQTGSTTNFPIYPPATATPPAFQTSITQFDTAATVSAFVAELTLQPTLTISPTTPLAFGTVTVGSTATTCGGATCQVTLTNNTSAAIPITLAQITAPSPSVPTDFNALTPSCGASVPANGSCTIAVTFTPSVVLSETATLPINYTAGNSTTPSTANISLSGTGSNYSVTPSSLTFPIQLVTSTSSSQPVTVTNTTAAPLPFTAAATAGFAESDSCSGNVPASGSCTLNVTFTPAAAGPATGTLTVTINATNQVVQLSGTGGDFSVTMPASITVTNNSGSGSANLTATSGFTPSVSFTCSTTIPNGTCTAPTTTAPNAFSISVSVAASVPPALRRFDGWRMLKPVVPVMVAVVAITLALLAFPGLRRRKAWLGLAATIVVFAFLAGCSGSSGSGSGKTYSLSLTGSTASNGTTVTHNFTTSVTVQ